MKKTFYAFCMGIYCILGGCHLDAQEGQKVFYWERPNTGVVWFAKDHRECMQEADLFPFEWPSIPLFSDKPKELKLRFDNNAPTGVWAQFVPYPGAHPLYVNWADDDWSVDYDSYEACMKERHYHERFPATQNRQVFPM